MEDQASETPPPASPQPVAEGDDSSPPMTPDRALAIAWGAWIAMLVVPFVLLLAVMVAVLAMDSPNDTLATVGAVVSGLWLMIAVPLAFLVREKIFHSYWDGELVTPASYLRGMLTIWVALEIGGVIPVLACLISGTLMPGLLFAAVSGMFFFTMWPSGSAMTDHVGNVADDEVFHHPR